MDSTISVSKGCFVFKNGATRADKSTKKSPKRKRLATAVATGGAASGMLGKEVTSQPFYVAYRDIWQRLQTHIEQLQHASYARTLEDLVAYVADANKADALSPGMNEIVPAAALLTGINQPDHLEQFETLTQRINAHISASVCVLQSRDCPTLKAAVETLVYDLVEESGGTLNAAETEDRDHKRLRRTQCTMKQLKQWYCNNFLQEKRDTPDDESEEAVDDESDDVELSSTDSAAKPRHSLIVILPDFECFASSVLQDLILILSAHVAQLPFFLILGVATAVSAVHSSLPYHVTSKIRLRVFQTQAAPVGLNEILDKVILSPKYAFRLSGKAFKFLTHIFLYYDFSINGFIQGFKYCLMEHYFQGNAYALCTSYTNSLTKIKTLSHDDMETIRRLLSFRPYVESINDCKRIIAILTDDAYLKKKLPQLLRDCHLHFMVLRSYIEFLTVLVEDLPKCPLGRFRRELYALCLSRDLVALPEFRECWQMLSFTSKDEFVAKISKAIKVTQEFISAEIVQLELGVDCEALITKKLNALKELLTRVVMAGMTSPTSTSSEQPNVPKPAAAEADLKQLSSRADLKERLLQMSRQQKPVSELTAAVAETLSYIECEIVACHLAPLARAPPLHELFVFADIGSVRRNIIGAPRAALHMALNNPHFYLQCKCCHLEQASQLLATLPDLSIVYKLHLECGRMINLFDWLQAFRAVVDFDESEQQEQVDPQIQARFTRAVAELQFLGYIKMSKRKTDHATRLTW